MKITQKAQEWGNSTGIRLPKKVLQAAKWQPHQEVIIDIKGRSVVLTPIKPTKKDLLSLDELLQAITPENLHDEVDWGSPVGKEIW